MEFRPRSQPNPFFLRITLPKIHVIFLNWGYMAQTYFQYVPDVSL